MKKQQSNERLASAIADGAAAVAYYEPRILEILGKLKPGHEITTTTLFHRFGLWPEPGDRCARTAAWNEQRWCEHALDALKDRDVIEHGDGRLRLTTDRDRRDKASRQKLEARQQEISDALGRNSGYDPYKPHVIFSGPALKKLVKLLEREGLISKEDGHE